MGEPTGKATRILQATLPCDDGYIAYIQWPESMSEEEYEDFKDWLDIMKRKIGRAARAEENSDD